ncbi:MAG TPA: hypothetical protein VIL36_14740 [Acidimicrobiales bacterium]|jgi:hypothetical protein
MSADSEVAELIAGFHAACTGKPKDPHQTSWWRDGYELGQQYTRRRPAAQTEPLPSAGEPHTKGVDVIEVLARTNQETTDA